MLHGVIYRITNEVNNKVYIGKTTSDESKYWNWHKSQAANGVKKVLYEAIRKYGVENFRYEVLHDVLAPSYNKLNKTLSILEVRYIKRYNSKIPNGYNVTNGGEGTSGHKRSEEFKDNLRRIKTGVSRPEWAKERMRIPKSEAHKEKLRKPKSELHKQKLKAAWGNKTPEEKKLISDLCIKNRRSYIGSGNPFYGKEHTPQTIETIRKKNADYQNRDDVKLQNKLKQPNRVGVDMVDPETNKVVKRFITITDAKRWIAEHTSYKGDVGTISKAVKSGKKSYGYYWLANT